MSHVKKYGPHRVITFDDGSVDLVLSKNVAMRQMQTFYTQRENRYYVEEPSNNIRNDGNALRRISRAKFEEIHSLIVAAGE